MNCKRAKLHIALLIGDDLEEESQAELREHLRECAPCREYHSHMAAAPQPWQEVEQPAVLSPHDSLWPDLLEKLPPRPGRRMYDFNGWWAAVAVVFACVAIGLFWNDEARSGRRDEPVAQYEPINSNSFPEFEGRPPQFGVSQQPERPPRRFYFQPDWRRLFWNRDNREGRRLLFVPQLRGANASDFNRLDRQGRPQEQ